MSDRRLAQIFHSLKQRRTDDTKKARCFQAYWTQNSGSRKERNRTARRENRTTDSSVRREYPANGPMAKAEAKKKESGVATARRVACDTAKCPVAAI